MPPFPRLLPLFLLATLALAAAAAERPAIDAASFAIGADAIPAGVSTDCKGNPVHCRQVRHDFKYPLARIETPLAGTGAATTFIGDHLMVRLRDGADAAALAQRLGMSVRHRIGRTSIYLLSFPVSGHDDLPQAFALLKQAPEVAIVEPDAMRYANATPNDPDFAPRQWDLNNTGQNPNNAGPGLPGADIHAVQAWDISTGSKNVVVGVIDTGIRYDHPDLVDNMWVNPGEDGLDATGKNKRNNAIDDDGNGYVDDWHGWNFAEGNNNPIDNAVGHGTHCAGTIGARGNNNTGIAGVCWQVSLVPIKVLGPNGGASSDVVAGILYASTLPLTVTSNSYGGTYYQDLENEAVLATYAAGQVFSAAAGNDTADNDTIPHYPCCYASPNMISVAATDNTDTLAYYSDYGATTVHLAAPGSDIWSCNFQFTPGVTTTYNVYKSGTSMACPHVSGAIALLKSRYPNLTGQQLRDILLYFTDPLPTKLDGMCTTGGRLNIYNALLRMWFTPDPPNATIKVGESMTFTVMPMPMPGVTYTYQWFKNGRAIPNANQNSFITPPAVLSDDQSQYYCIVTSTADVLTGPTFTLNVLSPPTILAPPAPYISNPYISAVTTATGAPALPTFTMPYTVNATQRATLNVAANSRAKDGVMTYQWQLNGTRIAGATLAAYTTPVLSLADNNAGYSCVLTNPIGTTVSPTAILTIRRAAKIVAAPSNAIVSLGYTTTFQTVADGTSPLTYQWQWAPWVWNAAASAFAPGTWTDIAGAIYATYTIPPAFDSAPGTLTAPGTGPGDKNTVYRCIVSNLSGNPPATSSYSLLSMRPSVAFTAPPPLVTIPTSGSPLLTATTNSTGIQIHFQWFQGSPPDTTSPVTGNITSTTYSAAPLSSASTYWVRATDGYSTADSAASVVTVDAGSGGSDNGGSKCGLGSSLTGLGGLLLVLALRFRSRRR